MQIHANHAVSAACAWSAGPSQLDCMLSLNNFVHGWVDAVILSATFIEQQTVLKNMPYFAGAGVCAREGGAGEERPPRGAGNQLHAVRAVEGYKVSAARCQRDCMHQGFAWLVYMRTLRTMPC